MSADDLSNYFMEFEPEMMYANDFEFDNLSENNDSREFIQQNYINNQSTTSNHIEFGVKEATFPADKMSIVGKKVQIQLPIYSLNRENKIVDVKPAVTPYSREFDFHLKIMF